MAVVHFFNIPVLEEHQQYPKIIIGLLAEKDLREGSGRVLNSLTEVATQYSVPKNQVSPLKTGTHRIVPNQQQNEILF